MAHALTKIWIHSIFGTKERVALIKPTFEKRLYEHITSKIENDLQCKLRIINGTQDHIHILFLMGQNFSLKDIIQNIKGESSHWVNQNNFMHGKFSWQTGYGSFSVSESMVDEVVNYIKNQKNHHKKITFKEEYDLFMKKYGLESENR